MNPIFTRVLLGGAAAAIAAGAQAQANHLVLSEVGPAAPGGAEYTEIFNPTNATVDLTNVWLSDSNLYKDLPTSPTGINVGTTDNFLRFPAGTTLAAGEVAVIVGVADTFLTTYHSGNLSNYQALPGSQKLFEVVEAGGTNDNPNVPNMISLNTDPVGKITWNLTNSNNNNGEFNVLFQWDGSASLVKDLDIVGWGLPPTVVTGQANAFLPKSSPYSADAGTHAGNLTLGGTTAVQVGVRTTINEPSEVTTGGNGVTGHDESTEAVASSWSAGSLATLASPGATNLTVAGVSPPPVVHSVERETQFPVAGQTVDIIANVTDPDNTVASVKIYVSTGGAFTPVNATAGASNNWTATVGPFVDDALVKYYVEAADNTGSSANFPASAPLDFKYFIVDNTPVAPGDVIINEILYDIAGADSNEGWEFVELHNTRNTPVKLSYFRIAENNRTYFTLPENAEIPAKGYMLFTQNIDNFGIQYTVPNGVQIYDYGTNQLNNGGDDVVLVHANAFDYKGTTTFLDQVVFTDMEPWPTGIVNSGKTIELKNPILDNSMGANWAASVAFGTPGEPNSVLSSAPVIGGLTRSVEFPSPNTPITIGTTVTAVGASTINSVRLYVDTGSGFSPITMTAGPNNTYTAQIPGQPDETLVKMYIEAVGSAGTTLEPTTAPGEYYRFLVDNQPVGANDVVINEILYAHIGAEAYEYVELYNRRATPVSLDNFQFGDATTNFFTFPEGSPDIPGNGYMVMSLDPALLSMNYVIPAAAPVLDWGTFQLNLTGDRVYIAHVNSVNFNGTTTAFDEVNYTNVSPWPVVDPDTTGRSIELLNPALDNSLGQNWVGSVPMAGNVPGSGTPGSQNTGTSSNVADWTLY